MPLRERAGLMRQVLAERLDAVLPAAMRAAGLDMWLVLCQEDDLDPVFRTLIPADAWCPILQMLVFFDAGDRVERLNLSMTRLGDLYENPWQGRREDEQWALLAQVVRERDPARIGINTGRVQWAAGGLTHNLYTQLVEALPERYVGRLESAETLVTSWAATLCPREIDIYEDVVSVAHGLLAECFSTGAISPGVTTTADLEWHYWQRVADLGLEVSFKPFFDIVRSAADREKHGPGDQTIRPGDVLHSDVGIRYLGLCSDHQQLAYVLRRGETGAPRGLGDLLAQANRLQDVFMSEFRQGLSGNELLGRILARARADGIPGPRVYSHSLGPFLHEPGPLIGLPWEQESCPGRGDVRLEHDTSFTMELSVSGPVPEWDGEEITLSVEEDVVFTAEGCRAIGGRQTEPYLI
jgi:Xaa-Pro aminopeptidase